jgi:AcrR family transcriptional regulator
VDSLSRDAAGILLAVSESARKSRLGRPTGGDSGETRNRIVNAAGQSFAQRGYLATTNKLVAAAAGVTQGAVHYHFGSKRGLFEAVCEQYYHMIIDRFQAAVSEPASVELVVAATLQASVEILRDQPWLATFTSTAPLEARRHPELAPVVQEQEDRLFAFLRDRVSKGQRMGLTNPTLDIDDVLEVLYALLIWFASRAAIYDPESYLRRIYVFETILGVQNAKGTALVDPPPANSTTVGDESH